MFNLETAFRYRKGNWGSHLSYNLNNFQSNFPPLKNILFPWKETKAGSHENIFLRMQENQEITFVNVNKCQKIARIQSLIYYNSNVLL